jgi:nucleoside-diphosphate-sugar epimerase
VIGKGEGIRNWVHIGDAAVGTCAAVTGDPGVYNIVNDQPVAQFVWLPAFARFIGAPETAICLGRAGCAKFRAGFCLLRHEASNKRAKANLAFRPRPLEWLDAQQRSAM